MLPNFITNVSAFDFTGPNDSFNISDTERNNLYSSNLIQTNTNTSNAEFYLGRLHKYLGYSTLFLAGIAAVSSSEPSVHHSFAYTAAGTALATCVTGYIKYSNRFNLDKGLFSEDNLHIMLGVLGTLGITAAIAFEASGMEGSHSGIGVIGASSMIIGVITIKW